MSAAVPIGARRMTHHSTSWMTFSRDSETLMNGSAALPTRTAAMPMSREITRIWRTLKLMEMALASLSLALKPKMFDGTTELMKPIQEPVEEGSAALAASTVEFTPGLTTRPTMMPMITEKNAVMANQTNVCTARRAALVTWRRLAMEVTTAVKTRAGMSSFSSCT